MPSQLHKKTKFAFWKYFVRKKKNDEKNGFRTKNGIKMAKEVVQK